jgi:uncharacterized membrane protein SirB2
MLEYYPLIRSLHITLVLASGTLFALRGLLVLAGKGALANQPWVRRSSYGIDTLLLSAALCLLYLLPLSLASTPWLQVKLSLLVVYVVLGSFALRRARSQGLRLACFVAAVSVYLFMVGIARAHHPWGWFA